MQREIQKSVAERARKVVFGQFSRTRPDDRVVELFLAWWEEGRFAANPNWLPQNVKNVEVVASDADGSKLAIEHTSIYAFEGHQREEKWLGQVSLAIETAPELRFPGRRFSITFNRDLFDNLNERKREEYVRALIPWLAGEFTDLPSGRHHLTAPALLSKKGPIEFEVQVDEWPTGLPPVSVSGMLPQDAIKRAAPQVEKTLKEKLPKLIDTEADRKLLLVELPTLDTSLSLIIDLIKNSSNYAGRLKNIDFVVAAKTRKDQTTGGSAWFFAYDTQTYELGGVGYVRW